jgi:hypothetical protein
MFRVLRSRQRAPRRVQRPRPGNRLLLDQAVRRALITGMGEDNTKQLLREYAQLTHWE